MHDWREENSGRDRVREKKKKVIDWIIGKRWKNGNEGCP